MSLNNIVLLVIAAAVLLAAEGIYYFIMYMGQRRRVELRRRLQSLSKPGKQSLSLMRERRIANSPGLEKLLRNSRMVQKMEKLLLQTDLSWTVASFIGLSVLLAAAVTVLLRVLFHANPGLALIGIPIGGVIPLVVLLNARVRRSQKISEQLPDALDMMVRSLRAGHSFNSGFQLVANEMQPPIAVEFGRCFEEQNFGVPFREAIENMTQRVAKNLDLRIFAVSVVIQRSTGGNLVENLEEMAHTVRERFKFYGRLRALVAEGKYSGYILGALPFACFAMVSVTNPTYLRPLWTDNMGRVILFGGIILWVLGVLWMMKMAKVDY